MKNKKEQVKETITKTAEDIADIARDQLDTFRKLDKNKQGLIIAVGGALFVLFVIWVLTPSKLNIVVERESAPVVGNYIAILNNENFDLGKTKIILNDSYVTEIEGLAPGETSQPIYVTSFKPIDNPGGESPSADTVPRKVKVISKKGRFIIKFK
jgi:hypothetical protein